MDELHEVLERLRQDKDLKDQLSDAIDTMQRLHERCSNLRIKLLFYVDQGQGLTQQQLAGVHAEIDHLFPRRVKNTGCKWDTDGDGNCGRPLCPHCGDNTSRQS